jgi:single-strand DNA-binding protein
MSSGPSRKTVSLAWGADPTRFSGARQKGEKRRIANVQERSQPNWFSREDAEGKAARDNSTNFTVLSLATKESWKNKQTNEWESRTEWHRILAFGKLGDFAATLTKGTHIEVEGMLRSREQTLELKGSSKKNPETRNVRSWFIRAESIRKLDRAETSSEDPGFHDVPF